MENIRTSYKSYKESTKNFVDISVYSKISALYNKFLIEKIKAGNEVTLPSKMGSMEIIGRKQKIRSGEDGITGLAPDWVKTKQLWERSPEARKQRKRLFHLNVHTEGYIFKYLWSKKNVMVKNKSLYSLRMTRSNKRAVNTLIMDGVAFKTK